jgi:hypothetical protein
MTKTEAISLVEQVYATFRIDLPESDEKQTAVYSAWYELLWDLEYEEVKKAFLSLAITNRFVPLPGEIRRATINGRIKKPQLDNAYVAWGKWLTLSREVNSGMPPSIEVSPALSKTIEQLGESAYGMHTNGDRTVFVQVYDRVVIEIESQLYAVPDMPTKVTPKK